MPNININPEILKKLSVNELKKIHDFLAAIQKFTKSGFASTPPEILSEREATCRACDQWDAQAINGTGRCKKCGCSTWAKLRMATERCPLGKWEAVSVKEDKQ